MIPYDAQAELGCDDVMLSSGPFSFPSWSLGTRELGNEGRNYVWYNMRNHAIKVKRIADLYFLASFLHFTHF